MKFVFMVNLMYISMYTFITVEWINRPVGSLSPFLNVRLESINIANKQLPTNTQFDTTISS